MHLGYSQFGRRTFLQLSAGGLVGATLTNYARPETTGLGLRIETDATRALVHFLSWDTEGGGRAKTNLLRAQSPLALRIRVGGEWRASGDLPTKTDGQVSGGTRYRLSVAPDAELLWEINPAADHLRLALSGRGAGMSRVEAMEMIFPFDPAVTPTTVLPSVWDEDGSLHMPGLISAPDFGQMLLSAARYPGLRARLEGSRKEHTLNLVLELPALRSGDTCTLDLTPVYLAPPEGLKDKALWREVRRGWFNAWQPSSRWGEQDRPFSAPAGILANNVNSDPVSFALPFYADQALWTPTVAPGISVAALVRRAVEWWLDHRTRPTGEAVGYWDYTNFLDANPGLLISAWDYIESTGDWDWLARRIERLEFISEFLVRRDVDGDGLVEATQSGNRGTLIQPARSCCWWDALNCGHKDGYTNAFIYRAWRCLADLEAKLGRPNQQARYTGLANRLKAAYAKTLYNPATGWLAWWKSADGELHDYATPIVNGLAIEYGLVEPTQGREILVRLWDKMRAVGFTRLDLGLPCALIPVPRYDYLLPDAIGLPQREDGTDTFGVYMNGGISAGHTLHFLAAHYVLNEPEGADMILRAMVGRQARVGFHNGVRDKADEGIDWTTWDGKPGGYEGYLADVFIFLQGILLREPSFRARYYRPLTSRPT